MTKLAPFLRFDDNAEQAAEFYLSVFPQARKLDELRAKGVGERVRPWHAAGFVTLSWEGRT